MEPARWTRDLQRFLGDLASGTLTGAPPRDCVALLQEDVPLPARRLFVVNVHMENRVTWWRGLFSDTARGRQAEALLATLPPDWHGILGGDLNTWLGPHEPAWRAMAARFSDTPADPSPPTFHDRLVLDHLFFDLPDGWMAIRRVISDSYGVGSSSGGGGRHVCHGDHEDGNNHKGHNVRTFVLFVTFVVQYVFVA